MGRKVAQRIHFEVLTLCHAGRRSLNRGALNGLMAEVMEGHVRFHVLSPDNGKNSAQAKAAEELIDVVRAYLK